MTDVTLGFLDYARYSTPLDFTATSNHRVGF